MRLKDLENAIARARRCGAHDDTTVGVTTEHDSNVRVLTASYIPGYSFWLSYSADVRTPVEVVLHDDTRVARRPQDS